MSDIFLHIPKNGGKTTNTILNRLYPFDKVFSIEEINPNKSNEVTFKNLPPDQRYRLELLKGHMSFGLHRYLTDKTKYFTFLRKPEERIISYYYFVLNQPQHRLFKQVKNLSIAEFVTQTNSSDLNNGQIRLISGINEKQELMLEKALDNIKNHFSFVGILERYDESLMFLMKELQWSYPFYFIKNKSEEKVGIKNLSPETLEIIRDYNKGDILLYNEVLAQMEDRINNSSFFYIRLEIFKSLNGIYSKPLGQRVLRKLSF